MRRKRPEEVGGRQGGGRGRGAECGPLHTADDQQQLRHALQVKAIGGVLRHMPGLRGTCRKIQRLSLPMADVTLVMHRTSGNDREPFTMLSWQQCHTQFSKSKRQDPQGKVMGWVRQGEY